jgi:hypothetical protein
MLLYQTLCLPNIAVPKGVLVNVVIPKGILPTNIVLLKGCAVMMLSTVCFLGGEGRYAWPFFFIRSAQ